MWRRLKIIADTGEKLPKNFKMIPVSDVCKIYLGGTPNTNVKEFWGGNIPWATAKDIVNTRERFISNTERMITQIAVDKSNAKIFPERTIVITSRGTIGAISLLAIPMAFNQTCYGLNTNVGNDPLFVYYALRNSLDKMRSLSYGTVFQTITMRTFSELSIPHPPLREQQAISKILSDLDEKIELNNQMNKTLEEIAQAIFKRWFIDFEFPNENGEPYRSSGGEMVDSELGMIPKGWEVKSFGEVIYLTMGVSPKGSSYNTKGVGIPLINGAADFYNGIIEPKKFTTNPVKMCKKGDLLFCIRATIGNLTYADKEYCIGRGVAALSPIKEIFNEYSYFTLEYGLDKLISNAAGSVIKGLSKEDILLYDVVIPTDKIILRFHLLITNIFSKKQSLSLENNNLSTTRDLLLPKLMTGKIRVPLEE